MQPFHVKRRQLALQEDWESDDASETFFSLDSAEVCQNLLDILGTETGTYADFIR